MSVRRMPSLGAISDHWAAMSDEELVAAIPSLAALWIGWGEPFCFGCGWLAPVAGGRGAWYRLGVNRWLDRAHLADHCSGGPDTPENMVSLCFLCHSAMPDFTSRAAALAWVDAQRCALPLPDCWQVYTDLMAHRGSSGSGHAAMLRLRGDYLAIAFDELATTDAALATS